MADDNRYQSETPHIMLFPHVVIAVEGKDKEKRPTGRFAYSANFLLSPDDKDFIALRKLVIDTTKTAFPAKYSMAVKLAGEKPTYAAVLDQLIELMGQDFPLRRGDAEADARKAKGKEDGEFQRGKYVLKTGKPRNKMDGTLLAPPAVAGLEAGRALDYNTAAMSPDEKQALEASRFFFGAEAYFEVAVAAYTAGNGGVKAYLNQVFATGKGTRMASGASAAETFGKHVGATTDVNPIDDALAELL